jgi:hypothetical protein
MKKTLFATIAFAVASMPLMFAAQAPASNGVAAKPAAAQKATKAPKKSTKKSTKTASAAKPATTTTAPTTPVKKQ